MLGFDTWLINQFLSDIYKFKYVKQRNVSNKANISWDTEDLIIKKDGGYSLWKPNYIDVFKKIR